MSKKVKTYFYLDRIPGTNFLEMVKKLPPPTWEDMFEDALEDLEHIYEILTEHHDIKNTGIFPYSYELFKPWDYCPLSEVKVVILGEEPEVSMYGDNPVSDGLAFSVRKGIPRTKTLECILKEVKHCYPNANLGENGSLDYWAKQGVFLLNKELSVQPDKPGSHKGRWQGLIKKTISVIINENPECIFMLWGPRVQEITSWIGETTVKLYADYPGYTSKNSKLSNFSGCKHFLLANEHLIKRGKKPIDWGLEPSKHVST